MGRLLTMPSSFLPLFCPFSQHPSIIIHTAGDAHVVQCLKNPVTPVQAADTLLFLKSVRTLSLFSSDGSAAEPRLLFRVRLSVPRVSHV